MNKLVSFFSILIMSFILAACGGGGSSTDTNTDIEISDGTGITDNTDSTDTSDNSNLQPMVANQPYRVTQGQAVEKTSANAEVKVEVDLVSGVTTVTLLSGTANLITP